MRDHVDTLDRFIEGAGRSDISDLNKLELVPVLRECLVEMLTSVRDASDRTAHRVPLGEIGLCDPDTDVAVDTRNENIGWSRNSRHAG